MFIKSVSVIATPSADKVLTVSLKNIYNLFLIHQCGESLAMYMHEKYLLIITCTRTKFLTPKTRFWWRFGNLKWFLLDLCFLVISSCFYFMISLLDRAYISFQAFSNICMKMVVLTTSSLTFISRSSHKGCMKCC